MKRLIVIVLLAVIVAATAIGGGTVSAAIFREYIGALNNGVTLDKVPINTSVEEVHFILAFAIDYISDGTAATNGKFSAYWETNAITPSAISAVKDSYSNVKFMLSLGGDKLNNHDVQFKATTVDSWVSNAVSSLTSLIDIYGLDGIDVDYEHFSYTTDADFTTAIGSLITKLKDKGVISVASIAPYPDVQSHYTALWNSYSSVIDYVNYQFYVYHASTSADKYVSYYNAAVSAFSGGAVLASFSTRNGEGPAPSTVLSACQTLMDSDSLPGIFIWCADNSYNNSSFDYETQAQTLLASSSVNALFELD